MAPFLAALSFLTIFPSPRPADLPQRAISDSRAWFPLVGCILGLVIVGLEWALSYAFSAYVTAAALVVFLVIINRALHLDGLMDTCDGLFGGDTPERRREIMRDPHVGAFAVAGAGCALLIKYGALVSLLSLDGPGKEAALLLFPVFSRYTMVLQLMVFPYVRTPGLGSPFHEYPAAVPSAIAAIVSVAAALAVGGVGGVLVLAGICIFAILLGQGMAGLAGGLTGDTYGATNEVSEAVGLLAMVAIIPFGLVAPIWSQIVGAL